VARRIVVNGESLVYVKGPAGSAIANLSELGLSDNPIVISIQPSHKEVLLDAWGDVPLDVQTMNTQATCTMTLIQFDPDVVEEIARLSMGGASATGRVARAGTLLGNGLARFAAGNNYFGLNIASPVGQRPWRFFTTYMPQPAVQWPLGAEKTVVTLSFRAIPYTEDPWRGGIGAQNFPLYDNTLDT
jgi:hypothetical protein